MGLWWLPGFLLVIASQECMSFSVGNSPQCPRVPPRISNRFLGHVVSPTRAEFSFRPHDSSAISYRLASTSTPNVFDPSTQPNVADDFARLVSNGFKQFNVSETANQLQFPDPLPSGDFITKYSIKSSSSSIEAWVLPSSMDCWILNGANSKQVSSLFKNVLIRRMDNHSLLLEDETIKVLLEGAAPIWIGLPGIGKSVASTVILVKALQSVIDHHEDNSKAGFEAVFYRVGKALFIFRYDDKDKRLHGREITGEEKDKTLWYLMTDRRVPSKFALIVDMEEDEKDPKARGFYTGSSRRAVEETFKSLDKSMNARFYLMDPPSNDELRLMYLVLAHFVRPLPAHIDSLAKFEAIKEKVGPVPRVLFALDTSNVERYVKSRLAAVEDPFVEIRDHSVSNVGDRLKYFLAPFVRDRNCIAKLPDNYEFKFLSEDCKLMLAQTVELPLHMEFLMKYGRVAELLEVMVKYGGALKPKKTWTATVPPACQLKNWLWSSDTGMLLVRANDKLDSSQKPEYDLCEREVFCADDALSIPVWKLEEKTLYQAATAKFPVVDWLFVNHTQKRVYGHRSGIWPFSNYALLTSKVDKVLAGMKFHEPAGKDYKLVIIGVNDASLDNPDGLRFVHNGITKSLSHFQQKKLWNNANRVETYLARIPAFQKKASVALGKDPPRVGIIFGHFLKDGCLRFKIEAAKGEIGDVSKTNAKNCPNFEEYVECNPDVDKYL